MDLDEGDVKKRSSSPSMCCFMCPKVHRPLCTPQALLDEATSYFRKALEFAPDSELHTAHYNMANVIADAADNGPCESKDAAYEESQVGGTDSTRSSYTHAHVRTCTNRTARTHARIRPSLARKHACRVYTRDLEMPQMHTYNEPHTHSSEHATGAVPGGHPAQPIARGLPQQPRFPSAFL